MLSHDCQVVLLSHFTVVTRWTCLVLVMWEIICVPQVNARTSFWVLRLAPKNAKAGPLDPDQRPAVMGHTAFCHAFYTFVHMLELGFDHLNAFFFFTKYYTTQNLDDFS